MESLLTTNGQEAHGLTLGKHLTLQGINLSVKQGEFVCIIGDVGSGKSSLLSALIGDMLYLDGKFISYKKERSIDSHQMRQQIRKRS
jgi:ABC-type phosphate/phosphonate transport system ATPase subunit